MSELHSGYGLRMSDADARTDALGAVSSLLWRERETLERLLYALTVERLVVASGDARWLSTADEHVRLAAGQLQDREVLRAAEIEALVHTMGLPPHTTLRELSEVAAEPWSTIFAEHRSGLRVLVDEIEVVTAENRRLLQAGAGAAREALDRVDRAVDGVSTYDSRGGSVGSRRSSHVLDQQA